MTSPSSSTHRGAALALLFSTCLAGLAAAQLHREQWLTAQLQAALACGGAPAVFMPRELPGILLGLTTFLLCAFIASLVLHELYWACTVRTRRWNMAEDLPFLGTALFLVFVFLLAMACWTNYRTLPLMLIPPLNCAVP